MTQGTQTGALSQGVAGREGQGERDILYLWLIHVDVWQETNTIL